MKIYKKNKRYNFLNKMLIAFLFITFTFSATAQNYEWKAKINKVNQANYYKIFLSSDITSQLNHSFPDIRIIDENKNEIQYILKKQKTVFDNKSKTELKITKNKHKKYKHFTEIEINNDNYKISNLVFKIINTHNPVFVKIYGSNNSKKWFVLKNNFPAVPEITEADTTEIKIMDIPNSNFKFFKVIFYDYDVEPIQVQNVYFYNLADIRAEYMQLPNPKISQKDTLNKSIITLTYDKAHFIDMISFSVYGPEYYLRKVKMNKKNTSIAHQTGENYYDQYKKEFYIGSLKSNRINLYDYKAKKIEFIIDNKDNKALEIYKANSYQLKNYIISYLHPNKEYYILFGNKKANFPNYDLPYFKDTIPTILPETYFQNIKKIKRKNDKINIIWNFPATYLWYSIGTLGILLIIISLIILKERLGKTEK